MGWRGPNRFVCLGIRQPGETGSNFSLAEAGISRFRDIGKTATRNRERSVSKAPGEEKGGGTSSGHAPECFEAARLLLERHWFTSNTVASGFGGLTFRSSQSSW